MSIEFDTPANRIIASQAPKNQFRVDTSLSDLALLRQLSVQGRLRYDSVTNGTLTITPKNGETYFLYKIQFSNTGANTRTVTLSNDGMVRATMIVTGGTGVERNIFDSLAGDGIKTMTITQSGITVAKTALGWVENTSRIRDPAT